MPPGGSIRSSRVGYDLRMSSHATSLHFWTRMRRERNEAYLLLAASDRYRDTRAASPAEAWVRLTEDVRAAVGDERATVIIWQALVAQVGEEGARAIVAEMHKGDDTTGEASDTLLP